MFVLRDSHGDEWVCVADQGLWFKLWCASLDDPDLDNLPLTDFGSWAKLGAIVKRQGTAGTLILRPPARTFCSMFQVPDFDALVCCFQRLPHVCVRRGTEPVSGETLVNVSFANWLKYQGDLSTSRVRRFRDRKRSRGDEKRGDEKRGDEKDPPPVLRTESPTGKPRSGPDRTPSDPASWPDDLREIRQWLGHHETLDGFDDPAYWRRIDAWLGAPESGVAYLPELAKYLAWEIAIPARSRPRDRRRAFRNWLAKSEHWSQSRAQTAAIKRRR